MWGLLLLASLLMAPSLGCIPCDKRGLEAMEKYRIFLGGQVREANLPNYEEILETAQTFKNKFLEDLEEEVLDKHAIYDIVSEFVFTLNSIRLTVSMESQLVKFIPVEFKQMERNVREIIQNSKKGRCPNKQGSDSCGLLVKRLINCKTCEEEKIICAAGPPENQEYFDKCSCVCNGNRCLDLKTRSECTPCGDLTSHVQKTIDCGERDITVTEDEDLDLPCYLHWYPSLSSNVVNIIRKMTDPEPKITGDLFIRIKKIQMEESGRYTCTSMLYAEVPIAKYTYNVRVVSGPGVTTISQAMPTETGIPPAEPLPLRIPHPAQYALSAAALSLIVGISIFIYVRKIITWKKPQDISPV